VLQLIAPAEVTSRSSSYIKLEAFWAPVKLTVASVVAHFFFALDSVRGRAPVRKLSFRTVVIAVVATNSSRAGFGCTKPHLRTTKACITLGTSRGAL